MFPISGIWSTVYLGNGKWILSIQILSGSGFDSGSGVGSKTYGGVVFISRSKTKSNTVRELGKACCQGPLSIPNRATHIQKVVGWEKANQSWLF